MRHFDNRVLLTILAVVAVLGRSEITTAQEIWFNPPDDLPRGTKVFSGDFSQLWTAPQNWSYAASHISVFVVNPYYAAAAPDDKIRGISTFLASRHIGLAVAMQSLPVDGCGYTEGMTKAGMPGGIARRLKRLGVEVEYFALDEPLYYGSIYTGKLACKYTVQEVAHRLAGTIRDLRAIYPSAKIVDLEPPTGQPLDEWKATLKQWLDSYRVETGTPLDAMALDSSWLEPWQQADSASVRILHDYGVMAGMFIDSTGGPAVTDQSWMAATRKNIVAVQAANLNLDFVIIASWMLHPWHNLPESDPLALSSLIQSYVTVRGNAH